MTRYLITTADERSWKFDRPVLFLGEWCRLYDRRHVWTNMDAEIAAPYGVTPAGKDRDLAYVQRMSSELLTEITGALNRFHGAKHSERYWHILIGQWLQRYVAVAFNRYFTLQQALESHELSGTTVFDSSGYSLATNDSLDFIWATNDDEWNHVFYGDILAFVGSLRSDVERSPLEGKTGFVQRMDQQPARRGMKQHLIDTMSTALPKLVRERDAFITNTYLPPRLELELQMSLGQAPQLWRREPVKLVPADRSVRERLRLDDSAHSGFEQFVRRQLPKVIPTCYLEGFADLVGQTERLPWPEDPRFIFTSNNFDTDEPFKAWTAARTERGTPYFTGQHGNNYGTLKGSENWTELVTCDAFYTWGWNNGSPRNVPAFLFKTAGRKPPRTNPSGGLLLIELPLSHRITTQDSYHEFAIYQEEQFQFAAGLPHAVRAQTTVRLHPGSRPMRWSDEARWLERYPDVRLEAGTANIRALIEQSRIVVHSYDSTGILETLAWNIPTLCFWQNGFDHLLPSARPYYEQLRRAGIIADSPEQAAALVSSHWEAISDWWESDKVQTARAAFCAEYARTERKPVRTLRRLLLSRAGRNH